ncbi:MAG: hypothetical protein FWD68_03650 [Alphaproteobacteria bacterium]|nr:hypothetical protein [Alphaproteobacteria bacterium]
MFRYIAQFCRGYLTVTLSVGGLVATMAMAQAQSSSSLWAHNGSILRLIANAGDREFVFEQPRPGMVEEGATAGALLFRGTAGKDRYEGTAYIFKAGCGQVPYRVSGSMEDDYSRLVMHGQAPRIRANCQIQEYVADTLVFSLVAGTAPRPLSQMPLLSEQQARLSAAAILRGEPYGDSIEEAASRIVAAELATSGNTGCGKATRRNPVWQLHVVVPKEADKHGGREEPIEGRLVLDARSGRLLCTNLPTAD